MTAIRRDDPSDPHLDPEILGRLVEGWEPDPEVRDHLSRCQQCFQAYSEAVQARSEWLQHGAGDPRRVAELARLGKSRGPGRPPGGGRRLRALSAGVAVAAAVVLIWWWQSGTGPGPELAWNLDPTLGAEILAYSADAFVLPGGEAGAAATPDRSRGTAPEIAAPAADAAWEAYLADPTRPEPGIEAVAGYLALGKPQMALSCLVGLSSRYPSDPRVLVLQGVADYQVGDTAAAERFLRRALTQDPKDALAALDLGLFLKREGRREEAVPILESVIRDHPGTPAAQRSERELGAP